MTKGMVLWICNILGFPEGTAFGGFIRRERRKHSEAAFQKPQEGFRNGQNKTAAGQGLDGKGTGGLRGLLAEKRHGQGARRRLYLP